MTKFKLKFIKGLIFFVIAMISIDFIVSKIFETKFSIYQNIIIGIAAYIGYPLPVPDALRPEPPYM